jgi:hypothetical protein
VLNNKTDFKKYKGTINSSVCRYAAIFFPWEATERGQPLRLRVSLMQSDKSLSTPGHDHIYRYEVFLLHTEM